MAMYFFQKTMNRSEKDEHVMFVGMVKNSVLKKAVPDGVEDSKSNHSKASLDTNDIKNIIKLSKKFKTKKAIAFLK